MPQRPFASITSVLASLALVALTAIGSRSQDSPGGRNRAAAGPTNPRSTRAVPRMPDGRAYLQGTWSFSPATPLERPAEFAGKEFLTDDDVSRIRARAIARAAKGAPTDSDSPEASLATG